MSIEVLVLGAMLRLARARKEANLGEITLRVGSSRGAVRAALRRLDARGLVERRLSGTATATATATAAGLPPRLTFEGFAVAVALLPARPSRVVRAVAGAAKRAA
ncbi:MAG: hypothetical protein ACRENE_28390 [Polyangiaceae bacterium]